MKTQFNPSQPAKLTIMNESGKVIASHFDSYLSVAHAVGIAKREVTAHSFSLSQESGYYQIHNIYHRI